jgi:hypothetical protein
MDHKHLCELSKLCPNTTSIDLSTHQNNYECPVRDLSKFPKLQELKLPKYFDLEGFMEFLNSKNELKLEKISFFNIRRYDIGNSVPNFGPSEVCEIFKMLFEKTELKEFERFPIPLEKEEIDFLCKWLSEKSFVKKLNLNCK